MAIHMELQHKNIIVGVLADLATNGIISPFQFFRSLLQQTTLPPAMKQQLANVGANAADFDARSLVEYGLSHDINPVDQSYTTLGSILRVIIESDAYGLETRRQLAIIVVSYRLYQDDEALRDLMNRFKIPRPAEGATKVSAGASLSLPLAGPEGATEVGPDINWRGTSSPDLALQSWSWSEPDYLDVGFLMSATKCAAAVCRVELPSLKRTGTGFLIGSDLLLTNYHVLKLEPGEDMQANAADVTLRFGFITTATGANAVGQPFKLVPDPIISSSPVNALDYVLVQVEGGVKNAEGVKPLTSIASPLSADKSLNIIQHPGGETLKIALSSNGVDGVYKESGLIQYLARAAGGSSGSPCFNDRWELVAIHHAERAKIFGSIREGILFDSIRENIGKSDRGAAALKSLS